MSSLQKHFACLSFLIISFLLLHHPLTNLSLFGLHARCDLFSKPTAKDHLSGAFACNAFRQNYLLNRSSRAFETFKKDYNLNFYPSRMGSRPFILCAYPKSGCTQWIMLLHFLMFGIKVSSMEVHYTSARSSSIFNEKEITRYKLYSKHTPKILIMRNPYERVLSSFFDFRRRAKNEENMNEANVSFPVFVQKYIKNRSKAIQPMDHRQPISEGCNIWNGENLNAKWDYILKLEEMELWADCIFKELNLTHIVESGWGEEGNSSLFHYDNKVLGQLIDSVLPSIVKKEKWQSTKTFATGHERLKREENLYTPHIISIINTVFERDFQVGRYPLWDGVSKTEFM